jgi:hypothetical protein
VDSREYTVCQDFKIDPPSFLTVPIKNEILVRVDMEWHPSLRQGPENLAGERSQEP